MIDQFEKIKLLKKSEMFSEVSTDNLRFIAQFMQEEVFIAGQPLFNINDHGKEMYIITSGKVGISTSQIKDDYVAILKSGESFGEMNLLDGFPRSASAIAIEDTTLLSLNKNNLKGLIYSYPEISFGIMRSLSLKLRSMLA